MNGENEVKVGRKLISQIMRRDYEMKFRKIKPISYLGNMERNLVLRCLYAQKFLQVLNEGLNIVNIDQTWISQEDFHQFQWTQKRESSSLPVKSIHPRVSMITALTSNGQIYVALTLVNTDSDIIMLFMSHLIKMLAKDDPAFRDKTVFLLDGAAYHKSRETRKYYDK